MKEVKGPYNDNFKTSVLNSVRKKSEETLEAAKTSHGHGLAESIWWQWPHYPT